MKKTLTSFLNAILMVFGLMNYVNAITYSLAKSSNFSVGGTTVQAGEKATYYDNTSTRWSYSNKVLKYVSGSYPASLTSSVSTVNYQTVNNVYKTGRMHKVKVTTSSYLDYTSQKEFTWTFDAKTNTLK